MSLWQALGRAVMVALRGILFFAVALLALGAPWLVLRDETTYSWLLTAWPQLDKVLAPWKAYDKPQLLASTLLALAMAAASLLGLALLWLLAPRERHPSEPLALAPPPLRAAGGAGRALWWLALALAVAVAAVPTVLFVRQLHSEPNAPIVGWWWLVMQAVALLPALLIDWRWRTLPRTGVSWTEWCGLAIGAAAITVVCSLDLNHWLYAFIGDEWAFFDKAVSLASQSHIEPRMLFGGEFYGVQCQHAPIASIYTSLYFRVLPNTNFVWRLSSVVTFTASLFPFYIVARWLLARPAAVLATVAMAVSHYLFAEAHMAYCLTLWRLVALTVVALAVVVLRSYSVSAAVLLGCACGYAFLVRALCIPAPLVALAMMVLFLSRTPTWRNLRWFLARPSFPRALLLLAVVVVMTVLVGPYPKRIYQHADPQQEGLRAMLWKTSLGPLMTTYFGADWHARNPPPPGTLDELLMHTRVMTWRGILAPLRFRASSHYVHHTVADPVLAGLAILGMLGGLALARRGGHVAFLGAIVLGWLVLAGITTPYKNLPVTRMHVMVPFWALYAGIGFSLLQAGARRIAGRLGPAPVWLAVAALGATMAIWNLNAFYREMPDRHGANPATLGMKLLQESPDAHQVYACLSGWGALLDLARHYPKADRLEAIDAETLVFDFPWKPLRTGDLLIFAENALDHGGRALVDRILTQVPGMTASRVSAKRGQYILACRYPEARVAKPPLPAYAPPPKVAPGEPFSLRHLGYFRAPYWHGPPYGRTFWDKPVRVNGERIEDVYASMTPHHLLVPLPRGLARFQVRVGLDDQDGQRPADAQARFTVLLDNEPASDTIVVSAGDTPQAIAIEIGDAEVLSLKADYVRGEPKHHVVGAWIEPTFHWR